VNRIQRWNFLKRKTTIQTLWFLFQVNVYHLTIAGQITFEPGWQNSLTFSRAPTCCWFKLQENNFPFSCVFVNVFSFLFPCELISVFLFWQKFRSKILFQQLPLIFMRLQTLLCTTPYPCSTPLLLPKTFYPRSNDQLLLHVRFLFFDRKRPSRHEPPERSKRITFSPKRRSTCPKLTGCSTRPTRSSTCWRTCWWCCCPTCASSACSSWFYVVLWHPACSPLWSVHENRWTLENWRWMTSLKPTSCLLTMLTGTNYRRRQSQHSVYFLYILLIVVVRSLMVIFSRFSVWFFYPKQYILIDDKWCFKCVFLIWSRFVNIFSSHFYLSVDLEHL